MRITAGLRFMLGVIVSVFAIQSTTVFATDYTSYSGFTTSEIPASAPEAHPKLWFDESSVQAMYAKRGADDYAKLLWNSIGSSPYLAIDFPTVPVCPSNLTSAVQSQIHHYYGDMSRFAKYNAFMYAMEGNETYKQRAIQALKRAYDGPMYSCLSIDPGVSSSPIDETYRANWAQNYAAAYDWVYKALSPEDNALIRDRLAKEAQVLYDNLYIWGPRNHNHRSKPAWGMGSLALALYDHPNAKTWMKLTLEAANTNTQYYFSSDGIYREGAHYYIYSLLNFVPFLYNYKNVTHTDFFPIYKPAFEWEFYSSNNKGWMPSFEDSYVKHNYLGMVAAQFMKDSDIVFDLHPTAKLGNLFQWRYQNTDKSPWGGELGMNNTGASLDDTMDIDKYLTYDPAVQPIAPTGTGTKFLNAGGESIFRNNWLYNDPSSRYLNFHGVAETDNHNHFDTLSFSIQAENQLMASTPGYSQKTYDEEARRSWYRTAQAYNSVTMDVKVDKDLVETWPVDFAENVTPASKYDIDTDFFDFQQKTARYISQKNDPTKNENPILYPPDSASVGYISRAVAFPGQDYFVVMDQLTGKNSQPQNYNLYLHGGRGTMTGTGNQRVWTYEKDAYGSPAKFATWIFSDRAALTDATGEITYVKGDYAPYGYVKATKNAVNTNFMQILIPRSISALPPKVVELSDGNRVGGTVEKDGNLDTFVLKQGNGVVSLGSVTTDGDFAYVRNNGYIQHWSVREATYLSYDGIEKMRSSTPITLALDTSKPDLVKGFISTDANDYSLQIPNPKGRKAVNATFKGLPVAVANDNGSTKLALSGKGELVVNYEREGSGESVAPGVINDLTVVGQPTESSVALSWTAPRVDGNAETSAFYDIRYSETPIMEANWSTAHQINGEPVPRPGGAKESFTVTGLVGGKTYYFTMKTSNNSLNVSPLSNSVQATTLTLTLGSVQFSDAQGKTVSSLNGQNFVNIKLPITNHSENQQSATILVALFKPNQSVDKMVYLQKGIDSTQTDIYQAGLPLPSDTTGYTLKVYVWDNLDTLAPWSSELSLH